MKPVPNENWRDWRDAVRFVTMHLAVSDIPNWPINPTVAKKLASVLREALQDAEEEREEINELIEAVCEKHGIPSGPTPMASLRKLLFSKEKP